MVGGGSMHIDELSYKIYKGGFETVTKLMVVAYDQAERRKILQAPHLTECTSCKMGFHAWPMLVCCVQKGITLS